jgi:hypothetical protein
MTKYFNKNKVGWIGLSTGPMIKHACNKLAQEIHKEKIINVSEQQVEQAKYLQVKKEEPLSPNLRHKSPGHLGVKRNSNISKKELSA